MPTMKIATDTWIAEALAERFCARVPEAVRLPALPIGCSSEHAGFPGTLTISDASGRQYTKPQEFLNGILGSLSFDPLEFANASQKQQLALLLGVVHVGIDLGAHAEQRKLAYDKRTDVDRA